MTRPSRVLSRPEFKALLTKTLPVKWKASAQYKLGTQSLSRGDVIDEKLCDDIIKYLAPTLEQHKGCTLVDFHPGVCLWSSKLHEFLQPKCHLLVEPEERYFEPFIKPLLDRPGSRYRHTYFTGHHPHAYYVNWRVLGDDASLLPPRQALPPEDPKLLKPDPTMLVTGNLMRRYRTINTSRSRLSGSAGATLSMLAGCVLRHEAFQSSGLVRMLWWMPEELKKVIYPLKVMQKQALGASLGLSFDISEVAGVNAYPHYSATPGSAIVHLRAPELDRDVDRRVKERSLKLGMSVPTGRKLLAGPPVAAAPLEESRSPFLPIIDTIDELEKEVSNCSDRLQELCKMSAGKIQRSLDSVEKRDKTLKYHWIWDITTQQSYRNHAGFQPQVAAWSDLSLRIINLEANFQRLKEREPEEAIFESLRPRLCAIEDERRAHLDPRSNLYTAVEGTVEEEIAFATDRGQVARDNRRFEPLKAKTADFWPENSLSLFDLMPKSHDLKSSHFASQEDVAMVCQAILGTLYTVRSGPITTALDRMAVNAGKELVAMVPAVTDILKGGRLDPKHLRARMVTDEMVIGLAKAFFEWPWRPDNWKVALGNDWFDIPGFGAAGGDAGVGDAGVGDAGVGDAGVGGSPGSEPDEGHEVIR